MKTHWKRVHLGDAASIDREIVSPEDIVEGTLFVGLENILSGGGFSEVQPTFDGQIQSAKFVFSQRHVLYGKLRPYLAKIALPNFSGVCSTDILPVLPGPSLDRRFLAHYLLQPSMVEKANSLAAGANLPRLSPSSLEDLEIPLPPLDEQCRIANILDRADALRAKRRAALARLDELTQAIFVEMFGDPVRRGWAIAKVADIVDQHRGGIRTGPFGSQLLHSEFVESGIAVLGIDNAVSNEFAWGERRFISLEKYKSLERYTVMPGDVLITIMGTCGRCAVVPDGIPTAINTKHLCCITTDRTKCLPDFLHAYFLQHPLARDYLARTAKGAIMDGLNMGLIKDMPIPLAPIPLQREFVERAGTLLRQKCRMRLWQSRADVLFASLQDRAFRGAL